MEQQINIIGGRSLPRRISFISEKYVAEAICKKTGEITTTVRILPTYLTALLRKSSFPIPKILQLIAFAFGLMSTKTKVLATGYFAVMLFVGMRLEKFSTRIQTIDTSNLDKHDAQKLAIFSFALIVIDLVFLIAAFIFIRKLASWHGAEHMAFAAYEHGHLEIEDIAKENQVSPKCGGRLFLPLILVAAISIYIAKHINVSSLLISPIFYELILWVDKRTGFDKIPPFKQASILLQHHLTTRRPGVIEIKTAQAALLTLLDAHRGTIATPFMSDT
ncbi:MAG: hypothetical protein A2934_02290 [Candidatus Sungbacteria bacterium RIFCSPLOWO2_01_FULL_47_10]|uniref:DUF1385 domain-containing protein n=1 Tax=Candidatus Sungbacteria bacterium RIFCSPLOWO2_01_FULL_47_10 TaxID=1802276 RepID=A0A1G2KYJ8_9BACT|nr:MAG: hypothetical protein A2934_02290 [Candidatus Sungbacteria bacterium RIFCSPLOWO2_01_FULL_47_10]